jgi:hypothetical protein
VKEWGFYKQGRTLSWGGKTMSQTSILQWRPNILAAAIAAVEALAEQVKRGNLDGELGEVQALLEALPLSSGDFCRVSNNLKNAQRYLQSQERGAAAYELRMIAGAVRTCLTTRGTWSTRRSVT